ncbi:unnamed protein product [Linum trigynum]|uniref:RING-type E3 ubiquitin transferase n=1 Tax=Linum trigynum TaxID=586398 RepID=A0AAV2DN44_9ROSI
MSAGDANATIGANGVELSGVSQQAAILITVFGGITLAVAIGGFYWLIRRFCRSHQQEPQGQQPGEAAANEGIPLAEIRPLPEFPQQSFTEAARELDYCEPDCSICLERFQELEMVSILPDCHHVYHPHCIRGWMIHGPRQSSADTTCPICRLTYQARAAATAAN